MRLVSVFFASRKGRNFIDRSTMDVKFVDISLWKADKSTLSGLERAMGDWMPAFRKTQSSSG